MIIIIMIIIIFIIIIIILRMQASRPWQTMAFHDKPAQASRLGITCTFENETTQGSEN